MLFRSRTAATRTNRRVSGLTQLTKLAHPAPTPSPLNSVANGRDRKARPAESLRPVSGERGATCRGPLRMGDGRDHFPAGACDGRNPLGARSDDYSAQGRLWLEYRADLLGALAIYPDA